MENVRSDLAERAFVPAVASSGLVLLLPAPGWWAENPGAVPGEVALEDALEDSPGLAILYLPGMVIGLVISLKALLLGLRAARHPSRKVPAL